MLTAQDLRGLFAIIPTPATPNAERYDADNTVDLQETERLLNKLLADGVKGLIALGTTGECATLTNPEYDAFVDCVLKTVNKRVPTFIGATGLGAHEAVRRLRFARQNGADGSLLGLPMWQPCTVEMAVKYYRSVSELFPDLALMVYANQRAFRFEFPADFWRGVSQQAPTVMSAKFSTPAKLLEYLEASNRRVNFVPNDGAAYRFAELSPDTTTAIWATAASMGPRPAVALADAILTRDMVRAKKVSDELAWASEPVEQIVRSPEIFASYNIQVEKTRINAAGYCNCGPTRPPYDVLPEPYAEASRECGRRWAEVAKRYASVGAAA